MRPSICFRASSSRDRQSGVADADTTLFVCFVSSSGWPICLGPLPLVVIIHEWWPLTSKPPRQQLRDDVSDPVVWSRSQIIAPCWVSRPDNGSRKQMLNVGYTHTRLELYNKMRCWNTSVCIQQKAFSTELNKDDNLNSIVKTVWERLKIQTLTTGRLFEEKAKLDN